MTPEQARAVVEQAVQSTFGISLAAGQELRRAETEQWDSLTHVELMFVVEELTGVELASEVMGAIDSTSMLVDALLDGPGEPSR